MRNIATVTAALALLSGEGHAFNASPLATNIRHETFLCATPADSRRNFLGQASALVGVATIASPAFAEEHEITACVKPGGAKAGGGGGTEKSINCVSTKNIKQVDLYSPPWTFEVSAEEAFARLKGAISAERSMEIKEIDAEDKYIKFEVSRGLSRNIGELLIKDSDKVVTFKVEEEVGGGSFAELGGVRSVLETIRKSSGVFEVMGGGMTADSYGDVSMGRGGGVKGQLKAFWGLQSGSGYEEVFDE